MSKKKGKRSLTLKESLKIALWSLGIIWKISPRISMMIFITEVYSDLSYLLNMFLIAKIVDKLIVMINNSVVDLEPLIPYFFLLGGLRLLNIINRELVNYSSNFKWRIFNSYLNQMHYSKVHSLGVQTVQLPSVSNQLKLTEEWLHEISNIGESVIKVIADIIKVIISSLVVFSFSLWIGFAVILISVISFFRSKHYVRKNFEWRKKPENMEGTRSVWESFYYLSNPNLMDEVSLIGAFRYFDRKIKSFYENFNGVLKRIMKSEVISSFSVNLLSLFVLLGGSIQIFALALKKVITIGDTTFYIGAINTFSTGMTSLSYQVVSLFDRLIKGKELYGFFSLEPVVEDGDTKLDRLVIPPKIEIKNISFHYPNSKRKIFEDFSLKIESGEKVAIVGKNGAGKSTIVKLLCRIYDPQKGEILINGINLKDLSINDWYKNVGVLFQDFNFYGNLSVEDNIYIGKSIKPKDRKRIVEAAKNADAHDFIKKYKRGYQTIMSERYKGGIKPSKGQEQKIAIARFFYRDAPFAIFDEPTSAIDADAEYKIFNRIYNFFTNKTVMIISHRFSTVRNADTIIVIKDGKIIEKGTHKELMKKDKEYADNFRKQAQGYN